MAGKHHPGGHNGLPPEDAQPDILLGYQKRLLETVAANAVNPKQGTGVYLPTWLIESRMADGIPVVRWSQPDAFAQLAEHLRVAETKDFCERELKPLLEALDPELQSFFGWDFARSGDLSVKMTASASRPMAGPPTTMWAGRWRCRG